jgi:hypothetical protein
MNTPVQYFQQRVAVAMSDGVVDEKEAMELISLAKRVDPQIATFRTMLAAASKDGVIDDLEAGQLVRFAEMGANKQADSASYGLGPDSPAHFQDEFLELESRGVWLSSSAKHQFQQYLSGLPAVRPDHQAARDAFVKLEAQLTAKASPEASDFSQLFEAAEKDLGANGLDVDQINFYLYELSPDFDPDSNFSGGRLSQADLTDEARRIQREGIERLRDDLYMATSF